VQIRQLRGGKSASGYCLVRVQPPPPPAPPSVDVILASIHHKYSAGPSVRPICTSCVILTDMIVGGRVPRQAPGHLWPGAPRTRHAPDLGYCVVRVPPLSSGFVCIPIDAPVHLHNTVTRLSDLRHSNKTVRSANKTVRSASRHSNKTVSTPIDGAPRTRHAPAFGFCLVRVPTLNPTPSRELCRRSTREGVAGTTPCL